MAKANAGPLMSALKSRSGQGLVAFILGAGTFFLIGVILSGFPTIESFLFNNLLYVPSTPHWSNADIFWGYAFNIIAGLITMAVVSAVIMSVVILGFRALGFKPKWPVLVNVIAWGISANILVFLLTYAEPFLFNDPSAGVGLQTFIAYAELLLLGLPYTFAWLWATRKGA